MVTLSTVQNITSTQDLQGARAYQAARAGIEWGAYQVLTPENTNPPAGQAQYPCPAATTINTLAGSMAGFSVQVLCVKTTYDEGSNKIGIYQLTSTATLGTVGSSNYVQRQLTAALSTCRAAVNGPSC